MSMTRRSFIQLMGALGAAVIVGPSVALPEMNRDIQSIAKSIQLIDFDRDDFMPLPFIPDNRHVRMTFLGQPSAKLINTFHEREEAKMQLRLDRKLAFKFSGLVTSAIISTTPERISETEITLVLCGSVSIS